VAESIARSIELRPFTRTGPDGALGDWIGWCEETGTATGGTYTVTFSLAAFADPSAHKYTYQFCIDDAAVSSTNGTARTPRLRLNTGHIFKNGATPGQAILEWSLAELLNDGALAGSNPSGQRALPLAGYIFRPFDDGPSLVLEHTNDNGKVFRALIRGRYFAKDLGLVSAGPTSLSAAATEIVPAPLTGPTPGLAGAGRRWVPGHWDP